MSTAITPGRTGTLLLVPALLLATLYLFDGTALGLPYPWNAALKASGIVLLALYAGLKRFPLVALALGLSAVGDVMLALQPAQMTFGIAAFGLAHIVYAVLFAGLIRAHGTRGLPGYAAAGVLALTGITLLLWLQPGMGDLRIPATIYNGVIVVMACLALISRAPMIAVAGALIFVLSDTLIALGLFMDYDPAWRGPAVWVTYVAAQFGLALGLTEKRPA